MSENRISKNLKFKIEGLGFDATFEKPVGHTESHPTDLKNLHYHVMYEVLPVEDDPIIIHTAESVSEHKNCFVCIPPFCKHRTIRKSQLRILFSYDKTQPKVTDFQQFMDLFFSGTEPFEIPATPTLFHMCSEIDNAFELSDTLADVAATSALKLIFCNIYKHHATAKNANYTTNESYLVKIDDIINDFQKDITLQSLAASLHLSTKQASRIIQKNYKKKLSEILIEKRLSVAAELLLRSNKTVSEIVEYVNFPSERYFYSLFKKTFGCTPCKYRKSADKTVKNYPHKTYARNNWRYGL